MHSFLADLIVAVHAGYVTFVVVGLLAILLGWALGWNWVRNPWFRWTHLVAILVVAAEAVCGIECPLTVWEHRLRQQAGEAPAAGSFVGRLLHESIFVELPLAALNAIHVLFAVAVLATLYFAPPRGFSGRSPSSKPTNGP